MDNEHGEWENKNWEQNRERSKKWLMGLRFEQGLVHIFLFPFPVLVLQCSLYSQPPVGDPEDTRTVAYKRRTTVRPYPYRESVWHMIYLYSRRE